MLTRVYARERGVLTVLTGLQNQLVDELDKMPRDEFFTLVELAKRMEVPYINLVRRFDALRNSRNCNLERELGVFQVVVVPGKGVALMTRVAYEGLPLRYRRG